MRVHARGDITWMPRVDSWERIIMKDCQQGLVRDMAGPTGSVCRDRSRCRQEGRCYFVACVERYLEQHDGQMPARIVRPAPEPARSGIVWHDGYDGYKWAV